jgi:hypothetical protein
MCLRRIGVSLSLVSLSVLGLAVAALGSSSVGVRAQTPDDRWPCVGQVNFDKLTDNPSLNLDPRLAVATHTVPANDPDSRPGPVDEAQLAWTLPNVRSLKCVWIGVQLPGTSYFMAQYILRPGEAADMQSLTIPPVGNAGNYCFRLVALTATEKGAFADRCAQIANPRVPRGPEDGPLPPDTGTGLSASGGTFASVIGGVMAVVVGGSIVLLSTRRLRTRR